jgi:hypothetical protein
LPNSIRNKTTRADAIRKVCAGLTKYYGTTNLVLAGTSFTPAALQTFLLSDIDANDASTQARAQWLNAVNVAEDTDSKTDPVLRAIRTAVQSQYGEAPNATTVLGDFGYAPRKEVVKTVATKATAVAKSEATREARHTMGPRQKAKVVGVLPAAAAPGQTASVSTSSPSGGTAQGSGSSVTAAPATPAAPAAAGATSNTSHQ